MQEPDSTEGAIQRVPLDLIDSRWRRTNHLVEPQSHLEPHPGHQLNVLNSVSQKTAGLIAQDVLKYYTAES